VVCLIALVTPPAERTEAVSPVAVKVCTRDRALSNCRQADGFLSVGVTLNSMAVGADAGAAVWATAGARGNAASAAAIMDAQLAFLALNIASSFD
jgi:hypothetical protein